MYGCIVHTYVMSTSICTTTKQTQSAYTATFDEIFRLIFSAFGSRGQALPMQCIFSLIASITTSHFNRKMLYEYVSMGVDGVCVLACYVVIISLADERNLKIL